MRASLGSNGHSRNLDLWRVLSDGVHPVPAHATSGCELQILALGRVNSAYLRETVCLQRVARSVWPALSSSTRTAAAQVYGCESGNRKRDSAQPTWNRRNATFADRNWRIEGANRLVRPPANRAARRAADLGAATNSANQRTLRPSAGQKLGSDRRPTRPFGAGAATSATVAPAEPLDRQRWRGAQLAPAKHCADRACPRDPP